MSELNLEAIKARLAAATPGPWIKYMSGDGMRVSHDNGEQANPRIGPPVCKWAGDSPAREQNLVFIAHAPTDLTACLAYIERLETLLTDCANRLEKVLIQGGFADKEYAAIAVEQYRGKS